MQKLIEIKGLTAGYDNNIVLENINLDIFENDFIGVIGPNGGGKTSLIKVILGLLKPYKGLIKNINNCRFGYLPQYNLFDRQFPISIEELVLSGLMNKKNFYKRYTKEDIYKARELIEKAGITNILKSNIGEVSGGQMQRALLCRAIISEPKVLLLDEPVTYVDNHFEKEMYDLLKLLNEKMAIIMVSHDLGIISSYIKTIACVNKSLHLHKSNIITEKTLENYDCPIDLITHGILPHRVLSKHK